MSEQEVVKETKNNNIGYKKPPNPGPGRPLGSKNKFTNLKNDFFEAYERIGGVEGLILWANESKRNKAMFYQWITKMLPTSIVGEQSDKGDFHPLKVIIVSNGGPNPSNDRNDGAE